MAELYELFKARLKEYAGPKMEESLMRSGTLNQTREAVKVFRKDHFDALLAGVKSGFADFKKVLTDQMVAAITNRNPYSCWNGDRITVFPDGCKYWYRGANACVCVVQENPGVRTLRFSRAHFPADTYRVYLPYVLFIVVFQYLGKGREGTDEWGVHKVRAGFLNRPLSDPVRDKICEIPLPDHSGLEVCMGRAWVAKPGSITSIMSDLITYYWGSEFRNEWTDNITRFHKINNRFHVNDGHAWNPSPWQALTAANPLDLTQVGWNPSQSITEVVSAAACDFRDLLPAAQFGDVIQDVVATTWEIMRERLVPSGANLESVFEASLVKALRSTVASVVTDAVTSMDGDLARIRDKATNELQAAGAKQTTFSVCPECLAKDAKKVVPACVPAAVPAAPAPV